MRPILERLLTEIDRSFEFYKQQFNESKIDRVYLSGGTANLVKLKEYLASGLGLPVDGLQSLLEISDDGDAKVWAQPGVDHGLWRGIRRGKHVAPAHSIHPGFTEGGYSKAPRGRACNDWSFGDVLECRQPL